MPRSLASIRKDLIPILVLLVFAVIVSLPSLHATSIDDLDSAHHLMDGYFFRDLILDHPHSLSYVFNYYKQYPALGFIFWPPLFPFVLGLFALVAGDHVLVGRACIFFFGVIFTLAFYALLRRQFPTWLAFCATLSAITIPGLFWSFNQIKLELPTLAVMCLALLAYLHARDKVAEPSSIPRALFTALALAAVVYTKQPAYFLYLAIVLDVLCIPALLRKRETWVTVAALVIFIVPLALFTLKFGRANLAQSIGTNTKLIMSSYEAIPRWSFAAWSYYPRLVGSLLNPVVALLGIGGLILCMTSRSFRSANRIWLGWFFLFYLTFSFYDNRVPRHSSFWWPAWIVLATACLYGIMQRLPRSATLALPVLFLLPVPFQIAQGERHEYADFYGQMPIVQNLFSTGDPGNILIFGPDKQTWIAYIREADHERKTHVLRGESLLAAGFTLPEICRKFRVGTMLVEVPSGSASPDASEPQVGVSELNSIPGLSRGPDAHFTYAGHDVLVMQYRYTGIKDAVMPDIPLSNRLM
ncbi:MAG TPA: glycosyltransferase family 39 protein [Granulicella sp.]